jgi:hypothetical protein
MFSWRKASTTEVSHVDILIKLALVEGKIDTLTSVMAEKRDEIAGLDVRVRAIELATVSPNKSVERLTGLVLPIMGGIAVIAFSIPLIINAINPQIHIQPAQEQPTAQYQNAKP